MEELKDAHLRLGVRFSSSDDEIKKAFRKLALEMHPDRAQVSGRASASEFQDMQQAFDRIMSYRANRMLAHQLSGAEDVASERDFTNKEAARQAQRSGPGAVRPVRRPGVLATVIGSCCVLSLGLYLGQMKYRFTKTVLQRRFSSISSDSGPKSNIT